MTYGPGIFLAVMLFYNDVKLLVLFSIFKYVFLKIYSNIEIYNLVAGM